MVERYQKQKVKNVVDNYDKSLKAIEEHRKSVQNGIMLKQEFRKLKEQDVTIIKERNTRLSNGRKNEVIDKQVKIAENIKNTKEMREMMKLRMVEEDVRDMHHRALVSDTFLGIKKGVTSPVRKSNRLGISLSSNTFKEVQESG
jgi:hypothetical protein